MVHQSALKLHILCAMQKKNTRKPCLIKCAYFNKRKIPFLNDVCAMCIALLYSKRGLHSLNIISSSL